MPPGTPAEIPPETTVTDPIREDADAEVIALLRAWLDEEQDDALDRACALAAARPVDVGALLGWVQAFRCSPQRRQQAVRALRAALRLPAIPGPACRPAPQD